MQDEWSFKPSKEATPGEQGDLTLTSLDLTGEADRGRSGQQPTATGNTTRTCHDWKKEANMRRSGYPRALLPIRELPLEPWLIPEWYLGGIHGQ